MRHRPSHLISALRRASLALAVLACAPAWAQATAGGTLAKLSSAKAITLGVRQDAAPFSFIDASGKPAGFSWMLCQAVVQQLSAELKTPLAVSYKAVSLTDSFKLLQRGEIDIHCGSTAHTAEREQLVAFSDTFYISRVVAAHRAQDSKYTSTREFGRVGVLQGSTAQQLMQNYAVKKASTVSVQTLVPLASYAEGASLLKSGAIDTLVADELLIPKDPAIARRPAQLTLEPYALVMRQGDGALVDAVDKALAKVLGSPRGKQMANAAGLDVNALTQEAWRSPNKHPAPPQF